MRFVWLVSDIFGRNIVLALALDGLVLKLSETCAGMSACRDYGERKWKLEEDVGG